MPPSAPDDCPLPDEDPLADVLPDDGALPEDDGLPDDELPDDEELPDEDERPEPPEDDIPPDDAPDPAPLSPVPLVQETSKPTNEAVNRRRIGIPRSGLATRPARQPHRPCRN